MRQRYTRSLCRRTRLTWPRNRCWHHRPPYNKTWRSRTHLPTPRTRHSPGWYNSVLPTRPLHTKIRTAWQVPPLCEFRRSYERRSSTLRDPKVGPQQTPWRSQFLLTRLAARFVDPRRSTPQRLHLRQARRATAYNNATGIQSTSVTSSVTRSIDKRSAQPDRPGGGRSIATGRDRICATFG